MCDKTNKRFDRLEAELTFYNITKQQLSELTDIPYTTLLQKMRGETPFKLEECVKIKSAIGSCYPIEELFCCENDPCAK